MFVLCDLKSLKTGEILDLEILPVFDEDWARMPVKLIFRDFQRRDVVLLLGAQMSFKDIRNVQDIFLSSEFCHSLKKLAQ